MPEYILETNVDGKTGRLLYDGQFKFRPDNEGERVLSADQAIPQLNSVRADISQRLRELLEHDIPKRLHAEELQRIAQSNLAVVQMLSVAERMKGQGAHVAPPAPTPAPVSAPKPMPVPNSIPSVAPAAVGQRTIVDIKLIKNAPSYSSARSGKNTRKKAGAKR